MKRQLATMVVLGLVASAGLAAAPARAEGDFAVLSHGEQIALDKKVTRGHATLVEFYSQTCATCKAIYPTLKTLPDKYPALEVKQVDIGDGDTPVVSQYNIEATPTFLLFDGTGKLAQRLVTGDMSLVETAVQGALPSGQAVAVKPADAVPAVDRSPKVDAAPAVDKTPKVEAVVDKPAKVEAAPAVADVAPEVKVDTAKVVDAGPVEVQPEVTNSTLDTPPVSKPKGKAKPRAHQARLRAVATAARTPHHSGRWSYARRVVPSGYTYVVRDHNTLFGITVDAMGSGARWRDLAALNHLAPGQGIPLGTVLRLPR